MGTTRMSTSARRLAYANDRLSRMAQREELVRRKAEAERAMLEAAVEAAGEGIVVTDGSGYIRYVNPAFATMTGYGREEVIGRDLHLFDASAQGETFYGEMRRSLRRAGSWSGVLTSRRKSGELFREECTISPVAFGEDAATCFVHVRRDVTGKQRLEALAETLNVTNNIAYVFSGIRQELGSPVNATCITLQALRDRVRELEPHKVEEYLERALDQLGRASVLLRSLRSFNTNEDVELESVDLGAFFELLLRLAARDGEARGVRLTVSVAKGLRRVRADPRALQQALLNLLSNGIDACEGAEGGAVHIEATSGDGAVVIAVSDNGCGMAADELARSLRPFETTKPNRTGLGLVIVRRMVSKMGGSVELSSEPGRGTRVEVRLAAAADA